MTKKQLDILQAAREWRAAEIASAKTETVGDYNKAQGALAAATIKLRNAVDAS